MGKKEYTIINGYKYPTVNGKEYSEETLKNCDLDKLETRHIEGFLAKGINPNLPDKKGKTLFDWCIYQKNRPLDNHLIEKCLDLNGNPNGQCTVTAYEWEEKYSWTRYAFHFLYRTPFTIIGGIEYALVFAALAHWFAAACHIFTSTWPITESFETGAAFLGLYTGACTGLCLAAKDAYESHPDNYRNVRKKVHRKCHYLAIAAERGDTQTTKMLLRKGANPFLLYDSDRGTLDVSGDKQDRNACYEIIRQVESIHDLEKNSSINPWVLKNKLKNVLGLEETDLPELAERCKSFMRRSFYNMLCVEAPLNGNIRPISHQPKGNGRMPEIRGPQTRY